MEKIVKQYQILFDKSKNDFKAAKNLYNDYLDGDDISLDIIFFHLQQAAEKLLKSLISFHKKHITKTHDINFLINYCRKANIPLIENIETLKYLTDFAVDGRYDFIEDDYDDPIKYFDLIEKLQSHVEKFIRRTK